MVHAFCQNQECKTLVHLDDAIYWNFKGEVKCERCGTVNYVEILNGEVIIIRTLDDTRTRKGK